MADEVTASNQCTPPLSSNAGARFVHRAFVVIGMVTAVVLLLCIIWYAADVFLLIFGGILLATFLRALSDPLSDRSGLPKSGALAIVIAAIAITIGLGIWRISGQVAIQFDQLIEGLPRSEAKLKEYLSQIKWGHQVLEHALPANAMLLGRADILARVTGFFSTALGILTSALIVLFVGLYIAADPGLYRRGLIHLVPLNKRRRAEEVCDALGSMLRWWLLGRLLSMTVVGVATTVGLWLLGVPAALALGFITFVLVFIPYLGPIVSAVPAVLFSLTLRDPMAPAYVALLYFAIQMVEGYLLTPLVQSRTVNLPAVFTLTAQVLMGVLLGMPGVVLATPLAAVALLLVKMLYVEDTLGDSSS